MRDLKQSDKNVLRISDAISGSEIELYYRMPTTSEQVAYQSKFVKRQGKKVVINAFDTRLEFGLKILTGFREGDFGLDGKAIASDRQSQYYREDWKDLVRQSAPDIINALAMTVFEGARVEQNMDMEYEDVRSDDFSRHDTTFTVNDIKTRTDTTNKDNPPFSTH